MARNQFLVQNYGLGSYFRRGSRRGIPGGKYYLYFPVRDKKGIFRIGAAVSSKAQGPFVPEKNYIQGSFSIDPCVLTDDDGYSWMAFGGIWGGQLQNWTTGTYVENSKQPDPDKPALCPKLAPLTADMLSFKEVPSDIIIQNTNGKQLLASVSECRYFGSPCLRKYN